MMGHHGTCWDNLGQGELRVYLYCNLQEGACMMIQRNVHMLEESIESQLAATDVAKWRVDLVL